MIDNIYLNNRLLTFYIVAIKENSNALITIKVYGILDTIIVHGKMPMLLFTVLLLLFLTLYLGNIEDKRRPYAEKTSSLFRLLYAYYIIVALRRYTYL